MPFLTVIQPRNSSQVVDRDSCYVSSIAFLHSHSFLFALLSYEEIVS